MGIGKTIVRRLHDLNWERGDLLARVPQLSPQNLSRMIQRDYKRSELDIEIAEALGMTVMELVYGTPAIYDGPKVTELKAKEREPGPMADLMQVAEKISDRGLFELIGAAKLLAKQYPKAKVNCAE